MCSALARHLRFCNSHCQLGVAKGGWRTVYTKVGLSIGGALTGTWSATPFATGLCPGCNRVASVIGSWGGRTNGGPSKDFPSAQPGHKAFRSAELPAVV